MRQRLLTLCLVAGCAVLVAAAFAVTASQDKTAPVITIEDKEKEITYKDGDDYEVLLADVTAEDNRDGDVTDQIFIDKITVVSDGSRAIVQYAVIDEQNNVGTETRMVNYEGNGQAEQDVSQPETEEKAEEETQKTEDTEKEDANAEEAASEETTEDNQDAQEQASAEEAQEENTGELTPSGVNPAIRLTETSRSIRAGETFDVLSVIDQVVDDQDDAATLSRRIHADGEYNTSVPGTYTIRYYVMDTNNNTSNIEEFTLTVQ